MIDKKNNGVSIKPLLVFIVLLNIVNLSFFKYYYFFANSLHYITGFGIFSTAVSSVSIILPLAISFYTFQLTAIQIDISRDKIKEQIPFSDYFLFILFFPQLIAGPIMRTTDFLGQIYKPTVSFSSIQNGMLYIMMGLFKKVVISDTIGGIIAPLYKDPSAYNYLSLFLGSFGFVSQVYCDFSGYTDIAIGLALLLGFSIPDNFRGPYLSSSFREFWTRWHVTLSTWLRDYLYIPLGGSRLGEYRANINMLITMTLGGLWHGADISFVIWGFYLGLILWIERILERKGILSIESVLPIRIIKTSVILLLFTFSGIFFRAGIEGKNSVSIFLQYFEGIFTLQSGKTLPRLEELVLFFTASMFFNLIQYKDKYSESTMKKVYWFIPILSIILLLFLAIFGDGGGDFIYFQF